MIKTQYIGAMGGKTVSTFANDNEVISFMELVEKKTKKDFSLIENEGKTYSEVRANVHNELMYIYLSRDLEGFENFDTLNLIR